MVDVATLGIELKSDSIVTATERMKEFTAECCKAEAAVNILIDALAELNNRK